MLVLAPALLVALGPHDLRAQVARQDLAAALDTVHNPP